MITFLLTIHTILTLVVVYAIATDKPTDFSCASARRAIDKPATPVDKLYDHFESEMARVRKNTETYESYKWRHRYRGHYA